MNRRALRLIAVTVTLGALGCGSESGDSTFTPSPEPNVFRDIAPGQYDLSARITTFDPGWGYDFTDYRYTAVLSIQQSSPTFRGTFRDMWFIGPGNDSLDVATAGVINQYQSLGQYVLDLVRPDGERGSGFTLTLVVDSVGPGTIEGHWGCCGHIAGRYTAKQKVP